MKGLPCTLQAALGTNRPYIKITGTITENVTVNVAHPATILAEPGASLSKDSGILLRIEGGSDLTVYDLTLTGTKGGADAISMQNGNTATLTLHRVKVVKNTGAGIKADGGTLNLFQSTIAENEGGGISMGSATKFAIRNNFIVRNGAGVSKVGGVLVDPAAGSTLEFNTIVDNTASGFNMTAGISCTTAISAPNNLVFGNTIGLSADPQIVFCDAERKSFRSEPAAVHFRKSDPNDYHLTPNTSPDILNKIDCTGEDIDGDRRPQNGGCDYGADEVKP